MFWSCPKSLGDPPTKRSGHSLSMVGEYFYLFGGNDHRKPAGPNNELFKLDINSSDAHWIRIDCTNRVPEPRSHHSATTLGKKIIIFGGFKSSNVRFNDVWIFDTETEEWTQPPPGITEADKTGNGEAVFKRPWADVPLPRGSHSATLIGNNLYIFGGYGGAGFARRDFNDLTILDTQSWVWKPIDFGVNETHVPEPRSGHQGIAVLSKLYILGGWNSMEQFNNMWVLDTIAKTWTKHPGVYSPYDCVVFENRTLSFLKSI